MYEEHLDLPILQDDTIMWRYMNFTQYVSLLEKSALFFCRVDELGDEFEGSVSQNVLPLLKMFYDDKTHIFHPNDMEIYKSWVYANCWYEGEIESEAMWRLHTREKEGIAIKTVFQNFKKALIGEQTIHVSRIKYIDYRTELVPRHNTMLPFIHKRKSFEHEREIRALSMVYPNQDEAEPEKTNGFYHNVDLRLMIEEIVVAPFAEEWLVDLTENIAHRYGVYNRVRNSTLSDVPNFVDYIPIPKKELPDDYFENYGHLYSSQEGTK